MRTTRPKVVWALLAAALAVVAVTILAVRHAAITGRAPRAADGLDAPQAAAAQPRAAGSGTVDGRAGDVLKYTLQMDSDVTVQGTEVLSFGLTGTWQLSVLSASHAGTAFRAAIIGSTFQPKSSAPEDAAELRALEPSLALPCFFTVSADGRVTDAHTAPAMPSLIQGIAKWVVAATQLVKPKDGGASWTAIETDTAGRYEAAYRTLGAALIEKRKVRYVEALRGAQHLGQNDRHTEVERSVARFELDSSGRLVALSVEEATRIPGSAPLPPMRSTTKLQLKLASAERDQESIADWRAERDNAEAAPLGAPASPSARRADIDRAKIGGLTFERITARWKQAKGTDRDAKTKRARLYVALAALLRQDEQALTLAVARIRAGDALADLFIDALGDAGSPQAQAALVDLFERGGLAPKQRRGALIALSLLDAPTADTVSALEAWLDDPTYGRQASYAVGASVHQLQSRDPRLAQVALEVLLDRLREASGPDELSRVFAALGNTGSVAALPAIASHLDSAEASVRAAAVKALRRMPAGDSDTLLAHAMTRDPSPTVRGVAASVAEQRQRNAPLLAAVNAAARLEPETSVRFTSVRILVRWMQSDPDLIETARWVVNNDPSQRIRDYTKKALERRSG